MPADTLLSLHSHSAQPDGEADRPPTPTPSTPAPTVESVPQLHDKLLVTRRELSVLTSLHVRTLARMDAANEIPGRVQVGRSVRYNLAVIRQWIDCGCDLVRWRAT